MDGGMAMEKEMFCFQWEQTAGCTGCVGKTGVCGKSAEVANIQDRLTGALIGLGRAATGHEDKLTDYTHRLVMCSKRPPRNPGSSAA